MNSDVELQQLAARAAAGDLGAFEELLRGIHGNLISYLYLLGVAPSDIEDVAQNVAIQLYRSLSTYNPAHPFLPWLRGTAAHVASNHRRSQTRESKRLSVLREYAEQNVALEEPSVASNAQISQLKDCIEHLQPKQKEIVTLRYFEGLDSSRIGKKSGLNAAAVRLTLFRIRELLRACVESSGRLKVG